MAISSKVTVTLDNTVFAIRQMKAILNARLAATAQLFADVIEEDFAGRNDHTLDDLRRLKHPYARGTDVRLIPDSPWWAVHRQTGEMLDHLYIRKNAISPRVFSYSVGIGGQVAEWVMQGTESMTGRPVLEMALATEANWLLSEMLLIGGA